jgi:hypothetical protein
MIATSPKVERLMLAMAEHEGWLTPGQTTTAGGSRAYRNHNPGNLRHSPFQNGTIDNFAYFRNDFIGWMAFYWDLLQKSKGNTSTGLGPKSTLKDLIFVWAPPSDNNDTERYLSFVEEKSGIKRTETLREIFE